MLIKHNKKIVVFLAVVLLILAAIVGFMTYRQFTNNTDEAPVEQTAEERDEAELANQIENTREALFAYQQSLDEKANATTNIEELQKLDEQDRGIIGLRLLTKLVANNQLDDANAVIDYIIARDDSYAIQATIICWQVNTDSARKQSCLARMTELARNQGIISEGEELPESYYEETEEELG